MNKERITQKKITEMAFIKDWCLEIMDFLEEIYPTDETPEAFRQIIKDASDKGDIRGLRILYNDVNEMAHGISKSNLVVLNRKLNIKFGMDLDTVKKDNMVRIREILQKGYLESDDEYRFVSSMIDEIYIDGRRKDKIDAIYKLMDDYEERKK